MTKCPQIFDSQYGNSHDRINLKITDPRRERHTVLLLPGAQGDFVSNADPGGRKQRCFSFCSCTSPWLSVLQITGRHRQWSGYISYRHDNIGGSTLRHLCCVGGREKYRGQSLPNPSLCAGACTTPQTSCIKPDVPNSKSTVSARLGIRSSWMLLMRIN